jgi:hypothetical protein
MTPRDFICTPSSWITDPRLNSLSDDAELLFRRLAACTDGHWRFPYDPSALEHSVRTAAFSPPRRFRAWNSNRIHRCLSELTAAGMLTRHYQGDRCWLKVADLYQYQKGRDPLGIESPKEIQPDLPDLEAGLAVLPPPRSPRRPVTPPPCPRPAIAQIPLRTEESREEQKALPLTVAVPDLAIVLIAAGNLGIPEDIAKIFYHDCEARPLSPRGAWTDPKGGEMRNWQSALQSFGLRWKSNNYERATKSPRHGTHSQTPRISPANANNYNASAAGEY